MPLKPIERELFYFGLALDKFAPHKAGRIVGLFDVPVTQEGKTKKCFRLQYGDGEFAHAEFVEESQGSYELLTWLRAVEKFGEDVFL